MSDVVNFNLDSSELDAELKRLQTRMQEMRPVMAAIAVQLLSETIGAFADERSPGGEKWRPLALSTIRGREKRGAWPGQILHDGSRKNSLHLSRSIVADCSPTHARVGVTPNPYAAIHQFGGMAGKGKNVKIEARPFLPMRRKGGDVEIEPKTEKSILSILRTHFST